jgi:hypothetical protein
MGWFGPTHLNRPCSDPIEPTNFVLLGQWFPRRQHALPTYRTPLPKVHRISSPYVTGER